jgi:CO dehydrogenase maturation factor
MSGERRKALGGKRIGVIGKGGSGKSTLTVLMSRDLRARGYEVYILDADSTNVGLHEALGIKHPPDSLIDYFGGMVFSGGQVTCPVDDPRPLPNAQLEIPDLEHKYYARNAQEIVLLTAGKIGDLGPGAGCDGPINKIARDLRLSSDDAPSVTLVDFKAGFEDSARGAVTSLNWIMVVVDPSNAAIQMAVHMKEMVEQIKAGVPPATKHLKSPELVAFAESVFRESRIHAVFVVLNKIKNKEMGQFLRDKLSKEGIDPIGALPEDHAITLNWLEGSPLHETSSVTRAVREIVDRLEIEERKRVPA